MKDPSSPTPQEMPPAGAASAGADPAKLITIPPLGPDGSGVSSLAADAPLREIAQAFRLNAEALHTLKEMQGDLARQVQRGDRSELVLQSTQSLNETFRNLSSVQQELLRRLHAGDAKRGGGPLIPLMLLGLLVVFLGGIWIVLDEMQRQKPTDPELAPAEVVRRERAAFNDGRQAGGEHAENEVRRLQESVEEAKARSRVLQTEIDSRVSRISELDQAKRTAELERDDFASQVRRAQSEMMAKRVLEEEVGSLKLQLEAANRAALDAEHERDLQRRKNAFLRERMADYGMGFREDDPPWRPDRAAGAPPDGMAPVGPTREKAKDSNLLLAKAKLDAMGGKAPGRRDPSGSASDDRPGEAPIDREASSVPPANYGASAKPATAKPAAPRGAAYGGDRPGALPPPILRGRSGVDANTTSVERVRAHLNGLLRGADGAGGAGWRIQSIKEVTSDRLGGVVMVRTDAGGRMVESVEATQVGIALDRSRRQVEFAFLDGVRLVSGQRLRLPQAGSRVVVAEGTQSQAWNTSSLRVIQKR